VQAVAHFGMMVGRFVGPRIACGLGARVEMMLGCALSLNFLFIQIYLIDQWANNGFTRTHWYAIDPWIAISIGVGFLLGFGPQLVQDAGMRYTDHCAKDPSNTSFKQLQKSKRYNKMWIMVQHASVILAIALSGIYYSKIQQTMEPLNIKKWVAYGSLFTASSLMLSIVLPPPYSIVKTTNFSKLYCYH